MLFDVVQKMNSARITRGSTSGGSMLAIGAGFFTIAVSHFWWAISESRWPKVVFGLCFLVLSVRSLIIWNSYRTSRWQIEWEGCHVRIRDGDHIYFEGDVSDMYQVKQDGRGYFLYLTKDTVFRLLRGRTCDVFEALLDNQEEAQQAMSGKAGPDST